ncbi:MAG: response regulator transcription factor, partial [Planctomycetota bacterium]|nr:response regulator transcription factor [Planctomycetota bacterium]
MRRTRILVVEDESAIRRGIVDALKFARYEVIEAEDGEAALEHAFSPLIDLILLDLRIPKIDGMDVLAKVRKARPTVPVIIISARGREEDRVRGLKEGADDYIVKPFGAKELLARIEAVSRRCAERPGLVKNIRLERCAIDLERREVVRKNGEREPLTEREAALIAYLAANPGRAVSREELLERLWDIRGGYDTRTIDMHIARLRAKLGDDPDEPKIIVTVRARGYMLGVPSPRGRG